MKHPTKHPWQRIKHVFAYRKWEDENAEQAARIRARYAESLSSAAKAKSVAGLDTVELSVHGCRRVVALG